MFTYPVYCIANIPVPVLETLLYEALTGSNDLTPNSDFSLTVMTSVNQLSTKASKPPLQPFSSPFIGQSVNEISLQLKGATYFAVLDERSAKDKTVILGEFKDNKVETVRVTFHSAQSLLTALYVGTLGFFEIQSAAAKTDGVYKQVKPEGQKKGGPAPRKMLPSR
ncbi:hypothetical protein F5Y11DRAFT_186371 [Daldinia sp. FL1419]|nr:hypothetical protein F5Y11DRAFT_186371 [Daldinia sp. FL1419]